MDRDGVLNQAIIKDGIPYPPKSAGEIKLLGGVVKAITLLKANNIIPIVVTNQPDVSRGITTRTEVMKINRLITSNTGIDHIYTCFHDDHDNCNCRKPLPGLILKSANDLGINLKSSYVIGDRWRDISAGQAAGCNSFFIDYSYAEKLPSPPFVRVSSLLEAVVMITGGKSGII